MTASHSEILGEDELKQIAAAYRRKSLIAWLKARQIPYIEAASGWPRVHVRALEAALGVGLARTAEEPAAGKINIGAIK